MTSPLYLPTVCVVALVGVLIILYDIWVVWKKGSPGTVSATILTWWLVHPFFMVGLWALMGHLTWPKCLPPGYPGAIPHQAVSAAVGTAIGVFFVGAICWEVFTRWRYDVPPTVTRAYLARLAVLAVGAVLVGHFVFGQGIVCSR